MECVINKVDPQSEVQFGANCRLSVLLCQDGFSFLVSSIESSRILSLSSYKLNQGENKQAEIAGWPAFGKEYFENLQKVDCTKHQYEQIDIAVASYKVTIAPHNFMESIDALQIIAAVHTVKPNEEILSEPVFDLGPVVAMLIPDYVRESCANIFPGSMLRSAPAVFVKGVMRKHSQLIARQIFINIHHEYFEITVIQGLRLLYLNTFRYSAPSDVLYYVVFVLEQLGFVPSEQDVILMGEISENSAITEQLKMYCGSLHFAEAPEGIELDEIFSDVKMYQYFTLLNIPLCE